MRGFRRAFGLLAAVSICLLTVGRVASEDREDNAALVEVIREAATRQQQIAGQIADYTCTLVKRERVNGQLLEHEFIEVKLRQRQVRDGRIIVPFSVYLRFLAPAEVRGREVIYVEGRNDGKLIARRGGLRFAYVTTSVDPLGELAMERNRYPITHLGIQRLIEELLIVAREELGNPAEELDVKQANGAKIEGRPCRMIQVTHSVRREQYRYHIARIFVDDQFELPIRFASYDWPDTEGGQPKLLEEYTYLNLKFNVGLTDWDFDHHNEEYQFLKDFQP